MPNQQIKLKKREDKAARKQDVHSMSRVNLYQLEICEECKKPELVTNHVEGVISCQSCGLVQQSRIIDDEQEWRSFSNENGSGGQNQNRVGGKLNPYISNYGIDTIVSGANSQLLKKWNDRMSLTSKDKAKTKSFQMLRDIAGRLNLKEPTIQKA